MNNTDAEFPTTIGTDAFFKGQLEFEKGVRLLGKFEGEVTTKGQLVIAEGASLSGEVLAGNVRVEGSVKGNLTAETKVQMSSSGKLEGDIQATRLEVAEGAILIGRCMVGPNGRDQLSGGSKSAPTSAASPAPKPKGSQPSPEGSQPSPEGTKK